LEFSDNRSWSEEEQKRLKASKFTKAQQAFILKLSEQGTPVAEICHKAGISQAISINWKKNLAAGQDNSNKNGGITGHSAWL
jgi:transposase